MPVAFLSTVLYRYFSLKAHVQRIEAYIHGFRYKRRRILRSIAIFALIVFLLPIQQIILMLPPMDSPVMAMKEYTNTQYGFTFNHYDMWTETTLRDMEKARGITWSKDGARAPAYSMGLVFEESAGYGARIFVDIYEVMLPDGSVESFLEFVQQRMRHDIESHPEFRKESSRIVIVDSAIGYEYVYTNKSSGLKALYLPPRKYKTVVLYKYGREYRITLSAAIDLFEIYDRFFFTPLIDSFKILA